MRLIYNLIAIVRKELQSYFLSPLSYIITAVFWLISGVFFGILLDSLIQGLAMQEQLGIGTASRDIASEFLEGFLGVLISLLLVLLPALSMGLYSEERKRGTLELLATSPITNWVVALGKLLGVVIFFTVLMIPLIIYEIIAFSAASPPLPVEIIFVSHLALLLLVTAILSLGMFISSLTESSVLAYILTFISILFLWIMEGLSQSIGGVLGDILAYLSLLDHYTNLIRGVLNPSSLVLFLSYIILGIFLTAQSIESLRYQRS
ncbi:MAG: ABC transporter permease [Microcystaceae cyanobacterium]